MEQSVGDLSGRHLHATLATDADNGVTFPDDRSFPAPAFVIASLDHVRGESQLNRLSLWSGHVPRHLSLAIPKSREVRHTDLASS
jgi:hypothetical protein